MRGQDIGILIAIILLLILSLLFSLCEISYSAANKVRLKTLQAGGKKRAGRVLKLLNKYDKVITTILIANTIVTVASATLATLLFVHLLQAEGEAIASLVASIVLTAFLLIFCEITPKMLAKERPEGIAMAMYPFLMVFMIIFWPFTALFSLWQKLMKKMFRIKNTPAITDEELLTFVDEAQSEGGIEKHESTLIKSAIEFEDVDVEDIMIPRVEVISISASEKPDNILEKFKTEAFSRMPVYSESMDNIVGILHERDFYRAIADKKQISEVLQKVVFVPLGAKISTVLRMLQKQKVHMAIVVDEFGGTSGIVTLEDILEELVGEIYDEHDEEEVLTKRLDDENFIVSGSENLEDAFVSLGVRTTKEFDSTTVGGFVAELAGHIPTKGEKFYFENLEIIVIKANAKRVIEVKIKLLKPTSEEE